MIPDWFGVSGISLSAILAIICVAGFVRGLTGFGLAVVLVPLVNIVLPPERTVMLSVLMGCLSGFLGFRAAWKSVDRLAITVMTLSGVAATPVGLYLLFRTPPDLARLLIAGIAVMSFFVILMPRPALPPPGRLPMILTGLAGGFLGAFAAIPGPPAIYYFARSGISPAQTRDSMIVIFLWAPLVVALFALLAGKLDWELVRLSLLCFPALVIGNGLGARFFGRVPERQWRKLILLIIAASALGAVIRVL
jgi:uncharacterized protein